MSARKASTSTAAGGLFYGYTVVAAASLIMVLVFSVHYAFGVFFKPVSEEFGWTRATTAGAFSLVWIAQGLLAGITGGLNDRFGPRLVLTICGVLIGTGFLLMSQITAVWQLYVFYGVIVGAGLGGTFVPLTSTTARWFVAKRGLMTGIVTAGVGLGAFVGPPIANWLIRIYDWRVSYMILGSVALAGISAAAQLLKRDPAQVGATPYGAADGPAYPSNTMTAGLSLREALRTRQFWVTCVVFVCYGFSLSTILLHLAPHATDMGVSSSSAANLLAALGGASVIGKLLLGRAADSIGNKSVYLVSFLLMAASLIWLVPATQLWALYVFAVTFGVAYGGLATAHSSIVAWMFGMKQHGTIFGVSFNGWTLGSAIGPIVAGRLFDVTHTYDSAFYLCTALAITGLLLTTTLKPLATSTTSEVRIAS
jgi:MFS transporter, OFA family, oxalate/formate antiporter